VEASFPLTNSLGEGIETARHMEETSPSRYTTAVFFFSVFLGNNCQINVKIDQQHTCLFIADVIAYVCFVASVCSVKEA
jgi:hypothetical protein